MAELFIGDAAFLAALGFLAGLMEANFPWHISAVAMLIAPAVFLILRGSTSFSSRLALAGTAIVVLPFFFALFYFHFFVAWRIAGERLPAGSVPFRALVASEPAVSDRYLSFSSRLLPPYSGTMTVFAPPGSEADYGDTIVLAGSPVPPRTPGGVPAIFPKSISVVAHGGGPWPMQILNTVKSEILRRFDVVLPGDGAALLGGLTVGGTKGIDVGLKDEMAVSETLYVVSMYGYKIAMAISAVAAILSDRIPRRARAVISGALAGGFVLMSGANLSAVRAGIAVGFLLLAQETGHIFSRRNGLALAAVGIAAVDPTAVGQPSFLFSFLSVAGMAFLVEPLRNFLRIGEGRGVFLWKEAVLFAVASLLPLIPLISVSFGSFSLSAIAANILIAPALPAGMALGAALAAASFLSWHAAAIVAQVTGAFLIYPFAIIRFFARYAVPLPVSFAGALSWILYYAGLAGFTVRYRKRSDRLRIVMCA